LRYNPSLVHLHHPSVAFFFSLPLPRISAFRKEDPKRMTAHFTVSAGNGKPNRRCLSTFDKELHPWSLTKHY